MLQEGCRRYLRMDHNYLTYAWLNPLLIGVIGFMIRGYLSSMDKKVDDIEKKVTNHIERVENFIEKTNERYFSTDKRITRLEDKEVAH